MDEEPQSSTNLLHIHVTHSNICIRCTVKVTDDGSFCEGGNSGNHGNSPSYTLRRPAALLTVWVNSFYYDKTASEQHSGEKSSCIAVNTSTDRVHEANAFYLKPYRHL